MLAKTACFFSLKKLAKINLHFKNGFIPLHNKIQEEKFELIATSS